MALKPLALRVLPEFVVFAVGLEPFGAHQRIPGFLGAIERRVAFFVAYLAMLYAHWHTVFTLFLVTFFGL